MGAGIESTLDHPLFGPGHTDNRTSTLVADGISELDVIVNNKFSSSIHSNDKPHNSGCR